MSEIESRLICLGADITGVYIEIDELFGDDCADVKRSLRAALDRIDNILESDELIKKYEKLGKEQ